MTDVEHDIRPACVSGEGFDIALKDGASAHANDQWFNMITKGMCLVRTLQLDKEGKTGVYACPLEEMTAEEMQSPDLIIDPTRRDLLGPTCKTYIMNAAALREGAQNA